MRQASDRFSPPFKAKTAARIWAWFAVISLGVRVYPLPNLVERLGRSSHVDGPRIDPVRLGRIVQRTLRLGRFQPRCVFTALILYRLLHEQGDPAQLVIGLPGGSKSKDAHAWVEIGGADVGPPPGRGGHQELARYG